MAAALGTKVAALGAPAFAAAGCCANAALALAASSSAGTAVRSVNDMRILVECPGRTRAGQEHGQERVYTTAVQRA